MEGLILPPGVEAAATTSSENPRVTVVNETDLPDNAVIEAVRTEFVEGASMAWGHGTTFQNYAAQGSLLARSKYTTPANVIEEIKLARDLAERDDDVAAALGWLIAAAYESGMQNYHQDERTKELFNGVAQSMKLDQAFAELYREWLIAAQVSTVMLFTREKVEWQAFGKEEVDEESMAVPKVGVLPAEHIRVLGNDIFGTGTLCYDPDSEGLRKWLDEYFDPRTSAARKAALGRADRVSAAMFTGVVEVDPFGQDIEDLPSNGTKLYTLNPRMVHRSTMPKGAWKYPRPPLTRNFALLEAKRLLNIMDYALLQGGSNYVVVAKKGDKDRPALPEEVENLKEVVRVASKSGVIVGDHRLSFEILTPDLEQLLNPQKRRLLGRKLAMALMRVPEHGTEEPGGEGMKAEMQIMARVITWDRHQLKRHVEANVYSETRKRNSDVLTKGTASIWFPKVILETAQFFTDYVLKLRDRGDIPRRWAVEAAGYNFEAALEEREREVDNDVDEKMAPAAVPFTDPAVGPQDNNDGRPRGAQDGRPTADPARPARTVTQNPGQTQRAEAIDRFFDADLDRTVRIGHITRQIMEEYEGGEMGRIKANERAAVSSDLPIIEAGLAMVPVNQDIECAEDGYKMVKLREGLRMIVGERKRDRAWVAKLLVFREPEFPAETAEDMTGRWGFGVPNLLREGEIEEETAAEEQGSTPGNMTIVIDQGGERVVVRDADGRVTGSKLKQSEAE